MLGTTEGRFALSANRTTDCLGVQHLHRQGSRTAGRRNSVEGEVALRAEPAVVAEGRGSPGGVLLGSERRRKPSRADVEGAQTSGNHSEKRAGSRIGWSVRECVGLRRWPRSSSNFELSI